MLFTPSRTALATALLFSLSPALPCQPGVVRDHFEAPVTHPLAVTPDGTRLLAVNVPAATLDVFDLRNPLQPVLLREIPVGYTPTSVAVRDDGEAWVTDFAGDCVHVIDLDAGLVVDTLPTGDEPGDVVFASGRAFVSATTDRQVVVFDTATRARIVDLPLFGDEPRAMATDGTTVWVASLLSGNDTTVVAEADAPPQPAPTNPALPPAPSAGLIVDSEDPTFTAAHGLDLPDLDVFAIDATSLTVTAETPAVGTVLFDLAVRPGSPGEVWVANTEARNLVRFEPVLRGHAVDNRLTRIGGGAVTGVFDLNPGLDYTTLPNPAARTTALAQPTGLAFSPDGATLFVAAFGTDRIGVVDPATGAVTGRFETSGATSATVDPRNKRGTRGLVHHATADALYVHHALSNSLSVFDTSSLGTPSETRTIQLFDPTPTATREGRGFLYDARLSGNGTMSCAACHIDGRTDNIAWDLGDPGGDLVTVTGTVGIPLTLHPMKGPMLTQTLQGLAGLDPLHWRGDRATFQDFNGAFDSLLGDSQLASADMDAFTDFVHTIVYPSNPRLALDRALPNAQAVQGETLFLGQGPFLDCIVCHDLTTGSNTMIFPGPVLQEPQAFKVAQLRNAYKRTGRTPATDGRSVAGYGFLHDGSHDSLLTFLSSPVFGPLATNPPAQLALEQFVLSFDTGTAPAVGYAQTVDPVDAANPAAVAPIGTLLTRAALGECDVVAHGRLDGEEVAYAYDPGISSFVPDQTGGAPLTGDELRIAIAASADAAVNIVGVLPGDGQRLGRDQDLDGTLDGDEGSQPYGAGTTGCSLVLRSNRAPKIGDPEFAYVVEGGPPNLVVVMYVSLATAAIPLSPGTEILVDLSTALGIELPTDARGTGFLPVPLPEDPALVGGELHAQAFTVLACAPALIAGSNGLTIQFGP